MARFRCRAPWLHVSALAKQETARIGRDAKYKRSGLRRMENPLLQVIQLYAQNTIEFFAAERAEYNHLVDAVDKLRRELTPRSFNTSPCNLLVQLFIQIAQCMPACGLRSGKNQDWVSTSNPSPRR